MGWRNLRLVGTGCIALLSPVASAARAEDLLPARTDVAGARVPPGFEPGIYTLAGWKLQSRLDLRTGYDSNLYAAETDPFSDTFVVLSPTVNANRRLGIIDTSLAAGANIARYADQTTQNFEEYSLRGNAGVEFGRLAVSAGAAISRTAERHGYSGAPLSFGGPSLYTTYGETLVIRRTAGAIVAQVTGSHSVTHYSEITDANGVPLSQRFRNAEQWGIDGRLSYIPSDRSALGAYVTWQRAHVPEPANYANETLGVGGAVGLDTGMFKLEAQAGQLEKRFDNPAFRSFSGLVYHATLAWYPTPLVTLSVGADKGLANSGVPTVGSIVTRSYRVGVDYELLRNLVIHASAAWRDERFPEIAQSAESQLQDIKGEYSFNRFVAIGAYAQHECKSSTVTATARRFCGTVGGLTLSIRR